MSHAIPRGGFPAGFRAASVLVSGDGSMRRMGRRRWRSGLRPRRVTGAREDSAVVGHRGGEAKIDRGAGNEGASEKDGRLRKHNSGSRSRRGVRADGPMHPPWPPTARTVRPDLCLL